MTEKIEITRQQFAKKGRNTVVMLLPFLIYASYCSLITVTVMSATSR